MHVNTFSARRAVSAPGRMPLSNVISTVSSGSETEAVSKKPEAKPTPKSEPRESRKRCRGDRSSQEERSTERFLRSVIGHKCGCKKHNCLEKFLDREVFESLQSYRAYYYDLHKLDQDSFVLWHQKTFNNCFKP